jgi:hypothetical protein
MNTTKKLSGLALATAAAGLFAMATPIAVAVESEAKVECYGVNSCKGKGSCASANNACKAQNACKGEGWVALSKEGCEALGGKVGKPYDPTAYPEKYS